MADNLVFFNLGVLVLASGLLLPAFLYAINRMVRRVSSRTSAIVSKEVDFAGVSTVAPDSRATPSIRSAKLVDVRWNSRVFLALIPIAVLLVTLLFLLPGLSVSNDQTVTSSIKVWVFSYSAVLLIFILCLSLYFTHKGDFQSISSSVDDQGDGPT
jgi:hypothetical protein